MARASCEFQVFAKPAGSICNLDCHYCYYLKKQQLYPKGESFRMPDDILEEYIVQHIEECHSILPCERTSTSLTEPCMQISRTRLFSKTHSTGDSV